MCIIVSHSLCPIDFFATSNTQVTTTQEVKTYLPEEPSASASAAAMDIIANGEQKNGAPPASLSLPGCGAGAAADGGAASTAGEEQASSLPMASPHSSSSADDPSTVRLLTRQTGKPLKLKRLLAVDLPVLCSSPMTAVSMLGGMDRLSAACTGNARKLHFYFRPEDKLSIPVPSQGKIPSSRLLLRVRLRKDGTTGDRTVVAKEVVGTISTTFQFTALADFQYLTTQAFLPVGTADVVSKTRLEIVPSSFVPVAHAGNYAYTSLKSSALANQDTARRQGVVIKFGCPIPKAPPAMLVNRPRRRLEKYGQVLEKLQALFDRTRGGREMWQRKALESKFEGDDLHAFLELLRVVAYNMSNGPWRGFWVKYGYDPSQDSVARLYQALDVRWKEAGLEKLKTSYGEVWKKVRAEAGREDEEEEGVEELKLFGLPVRRQMVFQLCDLGSASLQRLVLAVPRKAECTAQGGWFRLSDLTVLRGKIKRYLSGKVAECVRTGSVEPVTGGRGGKGGREEGALSPGEMILEAEARRGEEVVLPERGSGGSKGGGRGEGEGAGINGAAGVDGEREREECDGVMAAATRKSKRKATGGGRGGGIGGRGRGGRSKKKARRVGGEAEETHESESDEEEEEKKEGRYQNRGERDEEESYGQGRGDEEGMEDEEEAGARQLERLFGQPGRRTVDRARANTAAVTRGRTRHQGGDEDKEDDLGRTFVIPLTAGDVQNASSIRLLGGYQGADYSSSSSDDDDGSD